MHYLLERIDGHFYMLLLALHSQVCTLLHFDCQ
jgi:hypothetical protein